jgi:hypothetical protein
MSILKITVIISTRILFKSAFTKGKLLNKSADTTCSLYIPVKVISTLNMEAASASEKLVNYLPDYTLR